MNNKRSGLLIAVIVVLVSLMPQFMAAQTPQYDKFALWNSGSTTLRGANIFQRIVHPLLDGPDFLGSGYIGPPYTQADFNQLAALGANYVNLSVAGIYSISPPYQLDVQAQANLDDLIAMATQANLFAVISFRTGPGRSDFTFYRDGAGVWFDPIYLIETVWTEQAAQDAWVDMWAYAAARYKNSPAVIGYDVMVEPNSNALLEIYDPQTFYNLYTGSLYDWNQLAPRLITAIRQVDSETPILLAGNGWGGLDWLSYTYVSTDTRLVYIVHSYDPFVYTHQDYGANMLVYPGTFDADGDTQDDTVNRTWLDNRYANTLDVFRSQHNNPPMAITELGVKRYIPGAPSYVSDHFSVIEARGMNQAIWMYHASWPPFKQNDNDFDFMLGPNPANYQNVLTNALLQAIQLNWAGNEVRLSDFVDLDAPPARNFFTSVPITLTWNRVSGATGYRLEVADNQTFSGATVYSLDGAALSKAVSPADGNYYWRVQARLADGIRYGAWSVIESFTVDAV